MHFGTKSYLKSTRNHTAKHALHGACASHQEIFVIVGRLLDLFFFLRVPRQQNVGILSEKVFFFLFYFIRGLYIYIYIYLLLLFNNGSHQI